MTSATATDRPVSRYNTIAIVLHWLVAALMLLGVVAALIAANSGETPEARRLINTHKSIGLTIFGLVVLRILWRLARKPPPFPALYSRLEKFAAHAVHYGLYGLMIALPLTGYIHDSAWKKAAQNPLFFYGFTTFPRLQFLQALDPSLRDRVHDVFGAAHVYLGYGLYALLVLHLLGVAKHHAMDHEPALQRMLPTGHRGDP